MTIETRQQQVVDYLNDTEDSRRISERNRDYHDHKQWTPEQISKLNKRQQAAIVVNRIKPKVEGLVGMYILRNTDPKAYPRTQKHEEASHAATDALRYVADNNDFSMLRTHCAGDFFIEGTCGAITQVKQKKSGEIEIEVKRIPWDRIYYDPHSRELDFSDARFLGMIIWMDADEIKAKFPKFDASNLSDDMPMAADETFEDRPRWYDKVKGRYRISFHFRKVGDVWQMSIFSGNTDIIDEIESPFLDDEGEPMCPIELASANIDRDNNRYSEVSAFIDQQDEINHRRSKALHLLSQRQTYSRDGSIRDIPAMKRELAKPDGHISYTGEKGDFDILPTGDMAQGQFQLYQDAKAELDAVSINAQLSGERQQGDLSGRAIDKLQSAGSLELNRQYNLLTNFEKRIYKQIWARIKQFWNEEKWVRVTDDQDNLRWVGLNSQINLQKYLEEKINDESIMLEERTGASFIYQQMMKSQDPRLNQIIEVRNDTADLDVDIIIDQSFDSINVQQEQFQMITQFAQSSKDIDIIELIELSQLRGKEDLIEKIESRRAAASQAAGGQAQIAQADAAANIRKVNADAAKGEQDAIQRRIENVLLVKNPPDQVSSVSV